MGEEVHMEHALEDGGDLVRLDEQVVVEKTAAAVELVLVEEVKGYSCTQCPRVFSTGRALGGHMSSAHGTLKKFDSSSKKLKSIKRIAKQKNSTDFEIGKFTCKCCGKGFSSEKGVCGHMRLHPASDRRGTKPPTESVIENPVKYSLEPEILADGFNSEIAPIIEEDFIKNLRERTVTGRRGRRGTKPHKVDSPETSLEKKKALLSGDPQELRKILDHHDHSGYFRRAFGFSRA